MAMTTAQRERLVGQVFLGVPLRVAMEDLGVSEADVQSDPALLNLLVNGGEFFSAELERLVMGELPQE